MYTLLKSVPYPLSSSRTVPFGTFTSAIRQFCLPPQCQEVRTRHAIVRFAHSTPFTCRTPEDDVAYIVRVCVCGCPNFILWSQRGRLRAGHQKRVRIWNQLVECKTHTSVGRVRARGRRPSNGHNACLMFVYRPSIFLSSKHWCESADEKRKSTLRVSNVRVHNKMEVAGVAI